MTHIALHSFRTSPATQPGFMPLCDLGLWSNVSRNSDRGYEIKTLGFREGSTS